MTVLQILHRELKINNLIFIVIFLSNNSFYNDSSKMKMGSKNHLLIKKKNFANKQRNLKF